MCKLCEETQKQIHIQDGEYCDLYGYVDSEGLVLEFEEREGRGYYYPLYCPECGRRVNENRKHNPILMTWEEEKAAAEEKEKKEREEHKRQKEENKKKKYQVLRNKYPYCFYTNDILEARKFAYEDKEYNIYNQIEKKSVEHT